MKRNLKYWIFVPILLGLLLICLQRAKVWYDDAGHWHVARSISEGRGYCYLLDSETGDCDPYSAYITMGPAAALPGAWAMNLFGTDIEVVRWVTLAFTLGFVWIFFALIRRFLGERKAFWACLLIGGNIQFLVYGAEFLGEPFMLFYLFAGIYCLERWRAAGKQGLAWLALTALCWLLAIQSKEYIVMPLGFTLMGAVALRALQQKWTEFKALFGLGLGLLVGIGLIFLLRFGSLQEMGHYLGLRASYSSEFFAFSFTEPLRYLLFKPLILLGTLALGIRWYFRREEREGFLLLFQSFLLLFFLISEGYDRLGYILIFIPAIYLSEFCLALWKKLQAKGGFPIGRILFSLVFVGLFVQSSLFIFPSITEDLYSLKNFGNGPEEALCHQLNPQKHLKIFTYDQQLLPFLPEGIDFRLCPQIPANAAQCRPLNLAKGEIFLAGPYAFTEYSHCFQGQMPRFQLLFGQNSEYVAYGLEN